MEEHLSELQQCFEPFFPPSKGPTAGDQGPFTCLLQYINEEDELPEMTAAFWVGVRGVYMKRATKLYCLLNPHVFVNINYP